MDKRTYYLEVEGAINPLLPKKDPHLPQRVILGKGSPNRRPEGSVTDLGLLQPDFSDRTWPMKIRQQLDVRSMNRAMLDPHYLYSLSRMDLLEQISTVIWNHLPEDPGDLHTPMYMKEYVRCTTSVLMELYSIIHYYLPEITERRPRRVPHVRSDQPSTRHQDAPRVRDEPPPEHLSVVRPARRNNRDARSSEQSLPVRPLQNGPRWRQASRIRVPKVQGTE